MGQGYVFPGLFLGMGGGVLGAGGAGLSASRLLADTSARVLRARGLASRYLYRLACSCLNPRPSHRPALFSSLFSHLRIILMSQGYVFPCLCFGMGGFGGVLCAGGAGLSVSRFAGDCARPRPAGLGLRIALSLTCSRLHHSDYAEASRPLIPNP